MLRSDESRAFQWVLYHLHVFDSTFSTFQVTLSLCLFMSGSVFWTLWWISQVVSHRLRLTINWPSQATHWRYVSCHVRYLSTHWRYVSCHVRYLLTRWWYVSCHVRYLSTNSCYVLHHVRYLSTHWRYVSCHVRYLSANSWYVSCNVICFSLSDLVWNTYGYSRRNLSLLLSILLFVYFNIFLYQTADRLKLVGFINDVVTVYHLLQF